MFRGRGTCQAAMGGVSTLREIGARFFVSAVVGWHNVDHLSMLIDYCNQVGADSLQLGLVEHVGDALVNLNGSSPEDSRELARLITEEILAHSNTPLHIDFKEDQFRRGAQARKYVYCSAGTSRAAISPDGGFYPCVLCFGDDEYLIGNISRSNIQDLWTSTTTKWGITRQRITLSELSTCCTCPDRNTCSILNCRLSALYHNHDVRGVPALCKYPPPEAE